LHGCADLADIESILASFGTVDFELVFDTGQRARVFNFAQVRSGIEVVAN